MNNNEPALIDLVDLHSKQNEYVPNKPRSTIHARTKRGVTAMVFEASDMAAMVDMANEWKREKPHRETMNFIVVTITEEAINL